MQQQQSRISRRIISSSKAFIFKLDINSCHLHSRSLGDSGNIFNPVPLRVVLVSFRVLYHFGRPEEISRCLKNLILIKTIQVSTVRRSPYKRFCLVSHDGTFVKSTSVRYLMYYYSTVGTNILCLRNYRKR